MSGWQPFRWLVPRWREPRTGFVVRQDTTLAPQRLVIRGRQRVVIRRLAVRGYAWALVAIDCRELLIEDCDFSDNGVSEDSFLDINRVDAPAGGGIRLVRVQESRISRVRACHQDVGIDAIECRGLVIERCSLEHNHAWGIRLYRSSDNRLERNRARFVNRCGGTGCDAAGILLTCGSHRNVIAGNDLRWSGDGFFLGNQFSEPSDDNLIIGNDGSYSPNNAFEATFSRGNVFRRNRACWSNFGFWLGFSTDTVVEANLITDNRTDGIHWEHGARGIIRDNLIARNGRYGLAFTLDPANRDFPDRVTSSHHDVTGNRFVANGERHVYLMHTTHTRFAGNRYSGTSSPWIMGGRCDGCAFLEEFSLA